MAAKKMIGSSAAGAAPFEYVEGPGFCTTDGPWHLHDMEFATVCGPDHLAIADCNARSRVAGENAANARLIAAAPDLLEALKAAQKLAASGPAPLPPSDPRWAQIADAIAKAEGR